ncbi:MAG: hypothetical protein IKR93_01665 [Firmicutes bacterium]|nr:hypothetical protein [Bacillota bacterium]
MKFPLKVLQSYLEDAKLVIITGHFGSGKTEFAVNLALHAADCEQKLAIADLDIVNPYFLSRERQDLYDQKGIHLISSGQVAISAGLPGLSPEIFSMFEDPDLYSVVDVGGDPNGARVLARFADRIKKIPYKLIFILNANRPETATAESAVMYLQLIEGASQLKADAIVNNTHLCGETDVDCVLKGAKLAEEVSQLTGLPVICHNAPAKYADDPRLAGLPIFPMDVYMKKPWEL